MKNKERCSWVPLDDPLSIKYHDTEWGIPIHDDKKLFEFIILESAQAGLSWKTILHKREGYRDTFKEFDPIYTSKLNKKDIARLMKEKSIIRNRKKIESAIINAQIFLEITKEYGSFSSYLWSYVANTPIISSYSHHTQYPQYTQEAEKISNDLKKRGMKFFGPTITYAYMQAVGMVNDHTISCFKKSRHDDGFK